MLHRPTINGFKKSKSLVVVIDLLVICNLKLHKNSICGDGSMYLVLIASQQLLLSAI